MDMVEKVARALLASESNNEKLWDNLDSFTRTAFKRDARAAIEAMREHLWKVHGFAFTDQADNVESR